MEEEGSEEAARIADETSPSLAPHSSTSVALDDVGAAAPVHSSAPPRLHPAPPPPPSSSPHGALTDLVATTGISSSSRMEETGRISDETSSLAPDKDVMVAEPQVPNPTHVTSPAPPPRLPPPPPPPPSSTHGPHGVLTDLVATTDISSRSSMEETGRTADETSSIAAEPQVANPTPVTSPALPPRLPPPPPPPPSSTHGPHGVTGRLAATGSSSPSSSTPDHIALDVIPETAAQQNTAPPRLPPPAPPLPPSTYGGGGTRQRPWKRSRPAASSSHDDSTLLLPPESQAGLYLGVRHRPVRHHVNGDQASTNCLTWLSIQEEEELKQREAKLNQMEQELDNHIREAIKSRRELAIKRAEDIIELNQRKEQLDEQEEIIAAQEHKFQVEKEKDRLLNREKLLDERAHALRRPLIEHVRNKEEKEVAYMQDNNVWDKRQNLMAIALVCGLSVLISVQPQLPPEYLSWIVRVFAGLWVLATIAFQEGLFGVHKFQKTFSRHASRMIFITFCLFIIYVFYILSGPLASSSSSCVTTSSPAPPPAPAPSRSFKLDARAGWYIGLGILAVIGHVFSWCLGCETGGDEDA